MRADLKYLLDNYTILKYLTKKLMEDDKKIKEEVKNEIKGEFTEITQEELDALWNEIYNRVFGNQALHIAKNNGIKFK